MTYINQKDISNRCVSTIGKGLELPRAKGSSLSERDDSSLNRNPNQIRDYNKPLSCWKYQTQTCKQQLLSRRSAYRKRLENLVPSRFHEGTASLEAGSEAATLCNSSRCSGNPVSRYVHSSYLPFLREAVMNISRA